MISMIVVLSIIVIMATLSVKQNTTYGWFQSTVLGLLCTVPFVLGLIVDALQFGVSLLFRLAFALGGSSTSELIASHLTKKGLAVKVDTKGDTSRNPNKTDDDK